MEAITLPNLHSLLCSFHQCVTNTSKQALNQQTIIMIGATVSTSTCCHAASTAPGTIILVIRHCDSHQRNPAEGLWLLCSSWRLLSKDVCFPFRVTASLFALLSFLHHRLVKNCPTKGTLQPLQSLVFCVVLRFVLTLLTSCCFSILNTKLTWWTSCWFVINKFQACHHDYYSMLVLALILMLLAWP